MAPPIFWINMDVATDRRAHMERMLDGYGYDHTRVCAHTPDAMPPYKTGEWQRDCLPAEIACTMSHLKAMHAAVSSRGEHSPEYFVVCEDDLVMPHAIVFDEIHARAPHGYECLQIMCSNPQVCGLMFNLPFLEKQELFSAWNKYFYGAGMYMIRYDAAEAFLQRCSYTGNIGTVRFDSLHRLPYPFNAPLSDVAIYDNNRTYTINTPIVHCLDNDSYIHPQHVGLFHSPFTEIALNCMKHPASTDPNGPLAKIMPTLLGSA